MLLNCCIIVYTLHAPAHPRILWWHRSSQARVCMTPGLQLVDCQSSDATESSDGNTSRIHLVQASNRPQVPVLRRPNESACVTRAICGGRAFCKQRYVYLYTINPRSYSCIHIPLGQRRGTSDAGSKVLLVSVKAWTPVHDADGMSSGLELATNDVRRATATAHVVLNVRRRTAARYLTISRSSTLASIPHREEQ